jgi:hypothetical protein
LFNPLPRFRLAIIPGHLARRFHQICLGVTAEILEPVGVSPIEFALLALLDDEPGLDQRSLGAKLGIDAASISRFVERLDKAGLVDRRVDPSDRRARACCGSPRPAASCAGASGFDYFRIERPEPATPVERHPCPRVTSDNADLPERK